MSTMF